jgi:hypothetical protein
VVTGAVVTIGSGGSVSMGNGVGVGYVSSFPTSVRPVAFEVPSIPV